MWRAIYHEFQRWAKASTTMWAAHDTTEISVETHRVWIVRKSRSTPLSQEFHRELETMGRKEAAALFAARHVSLPDRIQASTEQQQLKEKDNEKH